MTTTVLIATNIVTIVLAIVAIVAVRIDARRERAFSCSREDTMYADFSDREDKLLQRIQAPQAAIAQQTVADAAQYAGDYPQPYIGAFDDDAAAEYERTRESLERGTRELIASVEGAE